MRVLARELQPVTLEALEWCVAAAGELRVCAMRGLLCAGGWVGLFDAGEGGPDAVRRLAAARHIPPNQPGHRPAA